MRYKVTVGPQARIGNENMILIVVGCLNFYPPSLPVIVTASV